MCVYVWELCCEILMESLHMHFNMYVYTDMMKIQREWTLASPNSLLIPGMASQMALTLPSVLMELVILFLFYFICTKSVYEMIGCI